MNQKNYEILNEQLKNYMNIFEKKIVSIYETNKRSLKTEKEIIEIYLIKIIKYAYTKLILHSTYVTL